MLSTLVEAMQSTAETVPSFVRSSSKTAPNPSTDATTSTPSVSEKTPTSSSRPLSMLQLPVITESKPDDDIDDGTHATAISVASMFGDESLILVVHFIFYVSVLTEEEFGVPDLLTPDMLKSGKVDKQSLMTYLSGFRVAHQRMMKQ